MFSVGEKLKLFWKKKCKSGVDVLFGTIGFYGDIPHITNVPQIYFLDRNMLFSFFQVRFVKCRL